MNITLSKMRRHGTDMKQTFKPAVSDRPKVAVASMAAVDETGTTVRSYLRTAKRANESENFRREVELIEKAILAMGAATPNMLRRYASALYKSGEFRAAGAVIRNPKCLEEGGGQYVNRLSEQLERRSPSPFETVLSII